MHGACRREPCFAGGLDVEIAEGDVRNIDSLYRAFDGADVVYHLASVISLLPGRSRLLDDVNVRGARNVAEACLKTGVRRLVYASSIHALAEPPHGHVVDESCPCDPSRIAMAYSRSKARGTLEIMEVMQKGLDAVVVLPTGMIGPYDFKPSETGRMIVDYVAGRIPARVEGGYDFVDVRDVAEGHILAAENGKPGEKYILSGEWISLDDIMKEISWQPMFRFLAGEYRWAWHLPWSRIYLIQYDDRCESTPKPGFYQHSSEQFSDII